MQQISGCLAIIKMSFLLDFHTGFRVCGAVVSDTVTEACVVTVSIWPRQISNNHAQRPHLSQIQFRG